MKRLLCGLLVLVLAITGWAADPESKPKPNTLTPAEVAEGWILLFDGESTFGWRSPNGPKWHVYDGTLYPEDDQKKGLLVTTTAFMDYDLRLQYLSRPDSALVTLVNCDAEGNPTGGTALRSNGNKSWTEMVVSVRQGRAQVSFSSVGRVGTLTPGPALARARAIEAAELEMMARREKAAMKDLAKKVPPPPPLPQIGYIAFSGKHFVLRDIKLKPADTKPLFNGKDLTGWKEHPGKKSKFSVTPEGWLNIKNGPGDLQTEHQWGDFVLQLECISNGKHLNSGVFFRCRPNEYQQGYEAQIHNGFTEQPAKEYTIEEYDPKTNELKDKKKVKSTAIDYGTGAIYRRVPARRGLAKDNEWFTMTVVAQGRHIATWVNGIQAVDWTDNRPLKDNARNGCRLEAGPISLQGHDPTTDLSFRNIRIEELAPRKGQEGPKGDKP